MKPTTRKLDRQPPVRNEEPPHDGIVIQLNRALKRKLASKKHSPLEEKDRILFRKVTFREGLTAIVLAIPAAGSMLLTYHGVSVPLSEAGATLLQKGQALGFSITVGVFAWLTWFFLFGLTYRLSGKRLKNALIAGGIMVVAIAAIDAPFNMLALSGSRAAQMSIVGVTTAYEERRSAIGERLSIANQLAPALGAQTTRFEKLEQDEIKFGTFSGRPGPGKVSAAFGQIATLLGALNTKLQTGLQDISDAQSALTGTLKKMKAAGYQQGPIRERMATVSSNADQADEHLAELREHDFSDAIDSTLASLETSLLTSNSSASGFAKTQAEQVNSIAGMIKPVAERLREALLDLKGRADISAPLPRPEDPMTAIFTHWRQLFTNWTASLFIGMAPAGLLVMLIAGYREIEETREARRSRRNPPATKEKTE